MLKLYAHPFSSYCWKALIALYEKELPFEFMMLGPDHPENYAFVTAAAPLGKFPVLTDGERTLIESSIIIEYLDRLAPDPRLIPADPDQALEVRTLDRLFDNYVMNAMQGFNRFYLRPEEERNPVDLRDSRAELDRSYAWLDRWMAEREYAAAHAFTLADIAAAPALFYADWAHPIPEEYAALKAYRARLLARPSIARAVDEARPWRAYFPPGAPDPDRD